jgi:glutamate-1-semialdehyde 2,1-aminomutase
MDHCRYTDFVGEYSAGLYGHSHPIIQETIRSTLEQIGVNLGAHTRYDTEFASLLCARFNLQNIRFCNSGTEANINALMAARAFTQKRKVVAFSGGYHGSLLAFRAMAVNNTINDLDFVVAEYNNIESASASIEHDHDVGAVLLEAMQGPSGNILGTKEFLHAVQASARKVHILLACAELQK